MSDEAPQSTPGEQSAPGHGPTEPAPGHGPSTPRASLDDATPHVSLDKAPAPAPQPNPFAPPVPAPRPESFPHPAPAPNPFAPPAAEPTTRAAHPFPHSGPAPAPHPFAPPTSGPAAQAHPFAPPTPGPAAQAHPFAPSTPGPAAQAHPFAQPAGPEPVPPPPIAPDGPGQVPYGYPGTLSAYGYPGPPHAPYAAVPYPAGNGYGWPGMQAPPSNGMGTASLVLGILSDICFLAWPLALVLGVLAIIFGALGRGKAKRGEATNPGVALAGLICGATGVVLVLILFAVLIAVLG
ncbi:DUF4190 domain-containing protein [Streptomyces rubradiris]|uniref:DUF4190 domain-containing protein n=1 Tax=Streptomyces rubradiris TaxID=285531 RepID=A0ABQ3RGU1_STRRR|nr:DUF4190 domain-containing protein [Streptomyces rubradiris]GHH22244.1 hypothetical protein GCM10018792_57720 [Streptomyces rubradiris]GHI55022.1 hypothetical protein Srubr_48680 [Streptomyces rubradiris]